jgi:hypothetical protein
MINQSNLGGVSGRQPSTLALLIGLTWSMRRYRCDRAASPAMFAVTPKAEVTSERWRPRYGPLPGVSASFTRVKAQLGNATVGAAEPPAKFAVDILHHDHIGVDVGLVVCVEVSGRELVQHGCALCDDGG